jgi:hypothetical protein
MKTALLIIVATIAVVVGSPAGGETTELCFPPAFSMRMETFDPERVDIYRADVYVDLGALKQRIDLLDDPGRGTRYYNDYAAHRWYEFIAAENVCTSRVLNFSPNPFCVATSARRTAVEEFAGRRTERWCQDSPAGPCAVAVHTVTDRGVRLPFMTHVNDSLGISGGPGHATFIVYANVAVAKHGLPASVFELPPACAALP